MRLPLKLLLTTDAVGGVWTYTLDLAQTLGELGVSVTVAALGPPPSRAQAAQAQATGADLRQLDAPLDWMATEEAEVAAAAQAIAALARALQADVVQVHSPALIGALSTPYVAVLHSCVATWWEAVRGADVALPEALGWRARLVREGLARASVAVAPSRSFADAVARVYGVAPPDVVRNARRTARLAPQESGDFILSAGRFWDEGKDLATLDRAAASCAWPVLAAGPLHAPFGGQATPRHLDARGSLDADALQALLARRPLFCSTAVYEPFGLAVLEAAQAGCALVLADIPTFRELWDGAALFATPRDPTSFAAALNGLARDEHRRQALGAAAARRALTFDPARQAQDMLALYCRARGGARAEAAA